MIKISVNNAKTTGDAPAYTVDCKQKNHSMTREITRFQ